MSVLYLRKYADKTKGERLTRYDENTGERYLLNPANGKREGWPLIGVDFVESDKNPAEAEPPKEITLSKSTLTKGQAEGWLKLDGGRPVMFPGGPIADPWRQDKIHTFTHATHVVFITKRGEVTYKVTRQPGSYYTSDKKLVDTSNITRYSEPREVFHDYQLQLVS